MNYRHLFDPLVIEKMWLLLKHVMKNTSIAFYYKFSCTNYHQLQTQDWTHFNDLGLSTSTAHIATNFIMHCVLLFATPLYMYNVYI